MEHNPDRDRWRPDFCCELQLTERGSARLPYGVAEPVLHGASAVELYTGSLWASADLVLLASDARILNAELMAEGFAGASVRATAASACGILRWM